MFSGRWPEPQIGQIRTELDGRMIPVSEAERREVFLRSIGNDHPLMDLILKCVHNHPQARAHASEIVGRLAEMVLQFPTSFANRLDEALRQIETLSKENRELREENRDLNGKIEAEKRKEIERNDVGEIQELRTETEQLKIENKTAGINPQNPPSPSHVSLTFLNFHRVGRLL
jgi:hypothetical protein